ncbi:YgiQ family radical SAM protein [Desulfosediminicola flagellatus]|uniref:YgiQ family radical SAM protein n=1 Tax=Desulfosediminicola flagellatus TaxID=2569541 RepID=UPI0010AD610C|nr:YgiQ family radical SAM protein [Desulfosediminicola flagellatus]
MTPPTIHPLPVSWEECKLRGWKELDILLVTGDAYVDHPSFGVALIGRYLEHHGYKVAILSQPLYTSNKDFKSFPSPKLFCGITGGNLDSVVANYTGNGKVRDTDAYSPGGQPWRSAEKNKNNRFRPDRAALVYSNLARSAFPDTPIVLGGLEASLRRFTHYDYKQNKLRASILTDAKADLLIYGMGEHAILDIARKRAANKPLENIRGCCERLTEKQLQERFQEDTSTTNSTLLSLPSFEEITADSKLFLDAELALDAHGRAASEKIILQKQQSHWVIQYPASSPLTTRELDALYELPYTRLPHPSTPDIPALRMIKDSVTIVRGCSGNCSFCAITRHQGATVQSRSIESITDECKTLAAMDDFKGTISDLGGPTANLYGTSCAIGGCKKQDCLYPKLCKHLVIDEKRFIKLLDKVASIENIRHVFISSGLRMELLLRTPSLLQKLIKKHIPGVMKIAPEHSSDEVLRLMHKEPHNLLKRFINHCESLSKNAGKQLKFVPYVISSHPGCTDKHAQEMADDMAKLGMQISKFQDFTPTPGTISTAMYVTGLDRDSKKPIYVARDANMRRTQRDLIERRFRQKNQKSSLTRKPKPYRKK